MECDSNLYCNLSTGRADDVIELLNAIKPNLNGEFELSLDNMSLDVKSLSEALYVLDTEFNASVENGLITIYMFPGSFPDDEKVYQILMPWLFHLGATDIHSEDLSEYGVMRFIFNEETKEVEEDTSGIAWDEMYVVFTGTMYNYTRDEIEERAEEEGATVQKTVNGKTTLLVVGEKPGKSKVKKATELNVEIIDEDDFSDYLTEDTLGY